MELDAVELEITAEVRQEEVANEVARAKQSLTMLVDSYCLVGGDFKGATAPRVR